MSVLISASQTHRLPLLSPPLSRFLIALVLCLGSAVGFVAQAANVQFWKYDDFELQGDGLISREAFEVYLPLEFPATLSDENLGEVIKSLYRTGFFQQIEVERVGKKLIFKVEEQPTIGKVKVEGNSLISDAQFKLVFEQTDLVESKFFNRLKLEQMVLALTRQYHDQGYYNSKLEYKLEPKEPNFIDVLITIEEGKPSTIDKIQIVGNQAFPRETLLSKFLLTEDTIGAAFYSTDYYDKFKFQSDLETLRNHYFNTGYARFAIKSSEVTLSENKRHVYLSINIHEGAKYTFGDVNLSGNFVVDKAELYALLEARPGTVFNRSQIISSLNRLRNRLSDDGYAYVEVTPNQTFDDEARVVNFDLFINPKQRVYVNQIIIQGNAATKDEVVRREIRQLEGAPYSVSAVNNSKQRIQRLGFFKRVDISTERLEDDYVNLIVSLEEQSTGSFQASIGYTQNSGATYKLGISEKNTIGTGMSSSINLESTGTKDMVNLSISEPYFTQAGHSFGGRIFYSSLDTSSLSVSSFSVDRFGASINYGIPFSEVVRLSAGFKHTINDLSCGTSNSDCIEFVDVHGNENSNSELSMNMVYDSRNKGVFATAGNRFSATLSSTLPDDDIQFYKVSLLNRYYKSLIDKYLTFVFKTEIRQGGGMGSLMTLPFYERYFAGGINSVRGFVGSTLGPDERRLNDSNITTNTATGGDFLSVVNLELVSPVFWAEDSSRMRLVAFADFGTVFREASDWDSEKLARSLGVGVQWLSPLGPIVFYWSAPERRGNDAATIQNFQFALGASL